MCGHGVCSCGRSCHTAKRPGSARRSQTPKSRRRCWTASGLSGQYIVPPIPTMNQQVSYSEPLHQLTTVAPEVAFDRMFRFCQTCWKTQPADRPSFETLLKDVGELMAEEKQRLPSERDVGLMCFRKLEAKRNHKMGQRGGSVIRPALKRTPSGSVVATSTKPGISRGGSRSSIRGQQVSLVED